MSVAIVDANHLNVTDALSIGPNMRQTLLGMMRPITLGIVRHTLVNFQTVERIQLVDAMGIVQPLSYQKLALKKEGTRTWDWRQIHTTTDLGLQTEDVIEITYRGEKKRFTVMSRSASEMQGYISYEIVSSYVHRPD